jgi:ABC-type branched-subunit amino acid transport system substrate-binding protein
MMKRAGGWLLGLLIVASLAGGGGFALRQVLNRETVRVGYFQVVTGRDLTDRAMLRGARLALDEISHRAGRFRVELGTPSEDCAAWIGSGEVFHAFRDSQPRKFWVSAFDTWPQESTGFFSVTPGFDQQGRAAAGWAKKSGAVRIVLIQERRNPQSERIASAFETSCRQLGVPLVEQVYTRPRSEILDLILAARPELVFYSGEWAPYAEAHQLFSALRAKGYAGTLAMGEAQPDVSFLATRPELVDGTYLVSPFAPAPAELAQALGTTPGPHVTAGYFAMKAVLEAIDRANSIDTADLERAALKLPYFDAQGKAALRKCALYVARGATFEFVELLD